MPKKTFFNLEPKKQEQIISQSTKAFSAVSFSEVKIATIIKMAEIPRSSFYDYFEDKLDLYSYIMLILGEKKKKYMKSIDLQGDFFDKLSTIIKSGVQFMIKEPDLDAVYKQLMKDPELVKTIFGDQEMAISNVYKMMLNDGIKDGSIRSDININFIARTINMLSTELIIEAANDDDQTMEDVIKGLSDDLIGFIQNGIGNI